MKNKKLIYLLDTDPFLSNAVSNRVISIIDGMIKNHIDVKLISLDLYTDKTIKKEKTKWETKYYFKKTSITFVNKILRRISLLLFFIEALTVKELIIYHYGFTTRVLSMLCLLRFVKKYLLIREITEYPRYIREVCKFNKYEKVKEKIFFNICDYIVVISKALESYVATMTRRKTLLINMTVEESRFVNLTPKELNIITYAGSFDQKVNGVFDLVKAFALFNKKLNNIYKLRIIGKIADEKLYKEILTFCEMESFLSDVEFTGEIDREDIPNLLMESKLLVLCRPKNKQTEGGFPTKLGEYLATGIPFVVTNVGEITNFIIDGVNGFISQSNDYFLFSEKMYEVINDYDNSRKIALEGKKLVSTEFSAEFQTKRLFELMYG